MHILLIPDSFKDSISATAIIAQLEKGFAMADPTITTAHCIASDGGEGFLDFVKKYVDVEIIKGPTVDPLGRKIVGEYAFAKASQTAYIELAKASGLEILAQDERNPLKTSTYGTGLQLQDAIAKGAQEIYVGLGGSATNDGGIGMAAALGYVFLDKGGQVLKPQGSSLNEIAHIRKSASLPLPKIYAINDVDNILTGRSGAAHTYAKQKGASPQDIMTLDAGLDNLAQVVSRELKINERNTPGTGAAGGSGYGLKVFGNTVFIPGVRFLARLSGIEKNLEEGTIDLIITGEGSIDEQTLRGKLVKGVAALGKKYHTPVIAICGMNRLDAVTSQKIGIKKIFSISDLAQSKEDSLSNAGQYILLLAEAIDDYWKNN